MNESSSAISADTAKFPGPMRYSVFAPCSTTTHHSGVLFAKRHQVIMEASQSKEIAFHCDMDAAAGRTMYQERDVLRRKARRHSILYEQTSSL